MKQRRRRSSRTPLPGEQAVSTDRMRAFEEAPWISLLPDDQRVALERVEADPAEEEWAALVAADRGLEDDLTRPSRSARWPSRSRSAGFSRRYSWPSTLRVSPIAAARPAGRVRPDPARLRPSPKCPSGTGSCSPRASLRPPQARERPRARAGRAPEAGARPSPRSRPPAVAAGRRRRRPARRRLPAARSRCRASRCRPSGCRRSRCRPFRFRACSFRLCSSRRCSSRSCRRSYHPPGSSPDKGGGGLGRPPPVGRVGGRDKPPSDHVLQSACGQACSA